MKDKLFAKPIEKKFEFDQSVVAVFDDMLARSVPFYSEVIDLIVSVILRNQADKKIILDLGSSTANFLLDLHSKMHTKMHLIGIDNSEAMIDRAKQKINALGSNINLELADILKYNYKELDVVVANYTLQFVRPVERRELIIKIYDGLNNEGMFIFSEKIVFDNQVLDKQMIDIYYNFKKSQGYSEYEIAQKREALENVLIPFTKAENIRMCKAAGFSQVEVIFQWANFATFLAKKCRFNQANKLHKKL